MPLEASLHTVGTLVIESSRCEGQESKQPLNRRGRWRPRVYTYVSRNNAALVHSQVTRNSSPAQGGMRIPGEGGVGRHVNLKECERFFLKPDLIPGEVYSQARQCKDPHSVHGLARSTLSAWVAGVEHGQVRGGRSCRLEGGSAELVRATSLWLCPAQGCPALIISPVPPEDISPVLLEVVVATPDHDEGVDMGAGEVPQAGRLRGGVWKGRASGQYGGQVPSPRAYSLGGVLSTLLGRLHV